MSIRKLLKLISFNKHLCIGIGLIILIMTISYPVSGLYSQHKAKSKIHQQPLLAVSNPQTTEPITIRDKNENDSLINIEEFSHDYQQVALLNPKYQIEIRDVITNKLITTLTGHNSSINGISWSPDNHILVSASADQTIRLWNVTTGDAIATFSDYSGDTYDFRFAWSPDSKTIKHPTQLHTPLAYGKYVKISDRSDEF